MAKIGVGIIGLSARGGWAAAAHVPALRALAANFEIRGLVGSDTQAAAAAAAKFGVPYHSSVPSELAERPEIDLVVITVKVPRHRELVEAAVAAGKAVYCEWPLGNGLEDAVYLAKLVNDKAVPNFVGLQARSAPPLRYLRDLVAQGYVGEVLSTTMVADGGRPWGGITSNNGAYLNDVTTGASMLTIPFGHSVDALCWALGPLESITGRVAVRRPVICNADTDQPLAATAADQVAVHGRLSGGAIVSVHFRGGNSRGLGFHWEINGTDGDLVVTGKDGHLQYGLVSIQGATSGSKGLELLAMPAGYQKLPIDSASHANTVAHAYLNVLQDLRTGSRLVPSFQDALVPHSMVDMVLRSADQL